MSESNPEMSSLKFAKQALRKEVKMKIAALSDEEKLRQSGIVANMLFKTRHWQRSDRLSIFLSMNDEIQTHSILARALEEGKKCFIPRYVGPTMDMLRLYSQQDYDSLPETAWKIKQPPENDHLREEAITTGGLDLVLMPGLAFSPLGQRLGRGKGYYDSFLAGYRQKLDKSPATVALAFNEQIYESIPISDHDESIDLVLYENMERTNTVGK